MKSKQNIFGVAHAVIWIATLTTVDLVFSESPSRTGYALLCCWWITLYISLLLHTSWRALPAFLGLMALALVIDVATGTGFLYHDAPSLGSVAFVLLLAGLLLLWASPVVINQLAIRAHKWFVNADNIS